VKEEAMAMKKVSEAYPSRFAKAADYPIGQRIQVRIREVTVEIFDEREPYCLWFVGLDGKVALDGKGVILNPTNSKLLGKVVSDTPEGWVGREVQIWSEYINFKGEIRVTWKLMPMPQLLADPAAISPPPSPPTPSPAPIVAPAANTRPRRGRPPKGNNPATPAKLPDLDDELPDFT
jgi:hypothetical protein